MWTRLSRPRQFATVAVAAVAGATAVVVVVTVAIIRVIAATMGARPEEIAVPLAGDDKSNGHLTVDKTAIATIMS